MSKLCGDGSCRFFCCEGIAMNAVAAHPRDRSGNADGGGNFPTLVQDRGGHAAGAHVGLLIVDGASLLHDANKRSEEHTSELQSHSDLVCRLLLEKKKNI